MRRRALRALLVLLLLPALSACAIRSSRGQAPQPVVQPLTPPPAAPDNSGAVPAQPPAPSAETPAPSKAPDLTHVRREELAEVPEAVRAWVERFRQVEIGVAQTFGDRTYLLVVPPSDLCREAANVIDLKAREEGQELVVTAEFTCTRPEWQTYPFGLGSIPATDRPVRFALTYDWLPAFRNPHGVAEVPLPPDSRGVLVQPAGGAQLSGKVTVTGFAHALFEGNVVVRLLTPDGQVVAKQATTAAGGMGLDWGSFVVELDLSQVEPGPYRLELGDHSMKDGSWNLMDAIDVTVTAP